MKIFRRILYLIVLCSCFIQIEAQSVLQIRKYSTSDGLPQRDVTNLLIDKKNFLWIATWNGLCRYDGYTFERYKTYSGDGNTLMNNRFHLNGVDKNNDIWFRAYDSRFYRFDTKTERFVDPLLAFEKEQNIQLRFEKCYNLEEGATWIVCTRTVFRLETVNGKDVVTEYSPSQGNLPSAEIWNIQQDMEGDEWVFTDKGTVVVGNKSFTDSVTYKEMCETEHSIFLISNNQLTEYDKSTGKYVMRPIPYEYRMLQKIQKLDKDVVVLATDTGFIFYSQAKNEFRLENLKALDRNFYKLNQVYKDKFGDIWVLSNLPGVIHIDAKTGNKRILATKVFDLPQGEKTPSPYIFEDRQGILWVIPNEGCLSYYDRQSGELKYYYTRPDDSDSRFNPVVLNPLYDNHSNLWFSDKQALYKVSFLPDACKKNTFDTNYEIRAFFKDDSDNLWVANKNGRIRIWDKERCLVGYLNAEGEICDRQADFGANVYCFAQDHEGMIWLGTKENGLYRLKRESARKYRVDNFRHEESDPYSLSGNSVYSVFQDSRKRIWVGSYGGGLNLLQQTPEGKVQFLHSGNGLPFPIKDYSKVRVITEAREALLVGTINGLLTFSGDFENAGDITFYENVRRTDDASCLSGNDVMYIYEDSKKDIYVLSFSAGINKVRSEQLLSDKIQFEHYTSLDGLPSDLVYGMVEDPMKNLWVVAENALFKFHSQNGTFESYGRTHLRTETCFTEAAPIVWDGNLVLGLEGGYLEVNPDRLQKSRYNPPIFLTELSIHGERQRLNLYGIKSLELNPEQRNIFLRFVALDYIDPDAIKYAYRMKGLEDRWNGADNDRQARYINLPPGKYEFQVKSTNADGVWFDDIESFPIHVLPTFWETGWAVALYAVAFVLFTSLVVYIFMTIYRLRHRVNVEKQLADVKLRFFTDISHELRTPLTLISSPVSEVLQNGNLNSRDRQHLELVHDNTERMLQLVNQILDFRKLENRKMKLLLEYADVVALLRDLLNKFGLLAEERQIRFSFQPSQPSIGTWVDKDKLQKIVSNLVSNAFKYTPDGKSIIVSVYVQEGDCYISVKDEGKGISPEKVPNLFKRFETLVEDNILQPSSGIGLSLVKEMVELHQGEIKVDSHPGEGSEFVVRIPMDKKVYDGLAYKEYILEDMAEVPAANQETDDIQPDDEKALTILVVDDNVEMRTFLKNMLNDTYKVLEAGNGKEGLEQTLLHLPDFIISDVMMPVMDGLDMVRAIKENRDVCHTPIILLTAKSSLDNRIEGLEQGVDDYLTKPFSATYLKTRIRLLLQQRRQLQQRFMELYASISLSEDEEDAVVVPDESVNVYDINFMKQVNEVMEKNLDNSDFTVDEFAQRLHMGRTIFFKKMKSLTGLSPIDFILDVRIKHSARLLETGKYNVSTVAYMTGFNDPKYFSKFFKKRMGVTPSVFVKRLEK